MESEVIQEVEVTAEPPKQYLVYYGLQGDIKHITKNTFDTADEYVVTENADAGMVASGHLNKNEYCISYNTATDKLDFMKRSDAGVFREPEDLLYRIPEGGAGDIGVKLYPTQNIMCVDISKTTKNKLLWGLRIQDISNPQGSQLNIYITEKNNPDMLIAQVQIDPVELVQEERLIIEIPTNIQRHANWNNISLFTRRLFENYTYTIYETFIDQDPKNDLRINMSANDDLHVSISNTIDGLHINCIPDIDKHTYEKNLQIHFLDATIQQDVEQRFLKTLWLDLEEVKQGLYIPCKLPEQLQLVHKYKLNIGMT